MAREIFQFSQEKIKACIFPTREFVCWEGKWDWWGRNVFGGKWQKIKVLYVFFFEAAQPTTDIKPSKYMCVSCSLLISFEWVKYACIILDGWKFRFACMTVSVFQTHLTWLSSGGGGGRGGVESSRSHEKNKAPEKLFFLFDLFDICLVSLHFHFFISNTFIWN